jgi:hypothetical protein
MLLPDQSYNAISQFYFISRFCRYSCYFFCQVLPERGGPFWQLKLRQMGIYGVQIKGVLHWLVLLARHASTRDFYPVLATPVSSVRVQNIFLCRTLFYSTVYVAIAQQPGQAVVPGRLSLNVCLWVVPWIKKYRERTLISSEYCLKGAHLRRMSPPAV